MPKRSKTKPARPSAAASEAQRKLPAYGPPLWAVAAVLAVALSVIYVPVLNVPFIYDDRSTVVENRSIVSLWPLVGTADDRGPLSPGTDIPTSGRPLVNLTFAVNYAIGGVSPTGYHAFNLAIHYLTSLLVFVIVRRTLRLPYFGGRYETVAGWLALAVAMLWALHPLQTESVIYATQRTELMMALFYLATLYCSLRYFLPLPPGEGRGEGALKNPPGEGRARREPGRTGEGALENNELKQHRTLWLALAILACLAGMASKEVMVSAPLMVLLFDRTFISGSLVNALRRSWPLYVGLAATWVLLLLLNINTPRSDTAGFGLRISAPVWWLTQAKVFLMYLKLVVWPWPLLIYYEPPLLETIGDAWMYAIPVALLGMATLILLWRNHPVGYFGTWVFAILAPTSIVPIVTEIAAERRMYLPLAALVVLAVVGAFQIAERLKPAHAGNLSGSGHVARNSPWRGEGAWKVVIPAAVLSMIYGILDIKHLASYREETTLWREVIGHEPNNLVAHNNLSDLLIHAGRPEEAIGHAEASLAARPDQPLALNNFGVALLTLGRHAEAKARLQEAVRMKPDYAEALSNLGLALTGTGQHEEAIRQLEGALTLDPNNVRAIFNLAVAYTNSGRLPDAIQQYERALRLQPGLTDAHINLGGVLASTGQLPQAIDHFREVVKARPNDPDAHKNLGLVLTQAGQHDDAVRHFEEALRLAPSRSDIHNNAARALRNAGRLNDAIQQFQAAVRLKPDDLESWFELAQTLAIAQRSQDAIATAEKAIAVARQVGQQQAVEQIAAWLKNFQAEQQR